MEEEFILKYKKKGLESIYQLPVISDETLTKFQGQWERFKNCRNQNEQYLMRDDIVGAVANTFLKENDKSFLSFVISCFDEFYHCPKEVIDNLQARSMTIYTRSLLMSSLSTIILLSNGHVDYHFLKDFYNLCYLLDLGLMQEGQLSFLITQACEKERNHPGSGLSYLRDTVNNLSDLGKFKSHPELSYEVSSKYKDSFQYPEILDLIKIHHEKQNGSGFPRALNSTMLSSTEMMLIAVEYIVPFKEHIFLKGDGKEVLSEYFDNIKKLENYKELPIQNILMNWGAIFGWATENSEEVA